MSLWVDKYRPRSLDELSYHEDISKRIQSLAASGDFPHMLFFGPSGAGKKTRIAATLRELYGPAAEKLKIDQKIFFTPSKRKLDFNVVQSNYHIELTPSDVGNWDRVVISEVIKEIAETQQIDLNAKQRFKVVVINEADQLSRDAQAALRRTMEKYMSNLRIIMCANNTSKIIGPIRSRCLLMRIPAPLPQDMMSCLTNVSRKEDFELPTDTANRIIAESAGNLRKALLMMEAMKMQNITLAGKSEVIKPDWEIFCMRTADLIVQEQSPARLLEVRGKLYELLTHCIPGTVIIRTIMESILMRVDEEIKADVVHWAAFYELRMRQGSKRIFHLEAFVAKVMSMIKHHSMGFEFAAFDEQYT